MARSLAVAGQRFRNALPNDLGAFPQDRRIQVALQRHLVLDILPRGFEVGCPVHAEGIAARLGQVLQQGSGTLGEQDHRNPAAVFLARQSVDDFLHAGEREATEVVGLQRCAPGIEYLHGLGTRLDLGIEVLGGRHRHLVHELVEHLGRLLGKPLDRRELAARSALDHVRPARKRASRKTDQGDLAVELATDGPDGIEDIAELFLDVRHAQCANGIGRLQGVPELRPFARDEIETQPHCIRNRQDIGEQDRRIEGITPQRLHRHLAGQFRITAQTHEVAGLRPGLAILRQIAARLAHYPHRRAGHRLAHQGSQQQIVLQFRHESPTCSAIWAWIISAAARGSSASRMGLPTTM